VGAHHHDQRRALLVGEQHRHVLARRRCRDAQVVESQLGEPLGPGSAAVRIGVNDQLGAARQRHVRGGVHVAEDQVGLQPLFQQRVGAAVDPDEHGPHVADVRLQRPQIAAIGGASDDDQDMAVAEVGPGSWKLELAREELALLADVRHGVLREGRQGIVDPLPLPLELLGEVGGGEHPSLRQQAAPAQHLTALDDDRITVAKLLEERSRGGVDEAHPGLGQQQRPRVRISTGRERGDVDHRAHAARDEIFGRYPVEVGVVDHSDVSRSQPLDEVLRLASQTRGAVDRGGGLRLGKRTTAQPRARTACAGRGAGHGRGLSPAARISAPSTAR
jgi:hypothetical protein